MKQVILEELIKKFGANAILRKKDIEEYVQSVTVASFNKI
jgi:hypothetical protein